MDTVTCNNGVMQIEIGGTKYRISIENFIRAQGVYGYFISGDDDNPKILFATKDGYKSLFHFDHGMSRDIVRTIGECFDKYLSFNEDPR